MIDVKDLKGSPALDEWKWRRKQELPKNFYATDVDLVLMGRNGPIAVLDHKSTGHRVTWTEKVLYKWFLEQGIPVFIITDFNNWGTWFDVYVFPSKEARLTSMPWEKMKDWEAGLRWLLDEA